MMYGVKGKNVGRLRKAMYGTRDAPSAWQNLTKATLVKLGYMASRLVPCVYFNIKTGTFVVAHVDDFLVLGSVSNLLQLKKDLRQDFEVDGEVLGPDPGQVADVKFLGRSIRWNKNGLEWESDQKHVDG